MPYSPVIEQDKAESGKAGLPEWEYVARNLERIEVPGGWLYLNVLKDTMAFVPCPPIPRRPRS